MCVFELEMSLQLARNGPWLEDSMNRYFCLSLYGTLISLGAIHCGVYTSMECEPICGR